LLYYYVQTGLVVACAIGVLFRRAVPSAATAVAQSAQPVQ
jgi:hypothetical protein